MKQQQNMTFTIIMILTDAQTKRPSTGKPDKKDIKCDETAAKIRRRLAEGATYRSIQNELHVSPKTICKIKKQMVKDEQ